MSHIPSADMIRRRDDSGMVQVRWLADDQAVIVGPPARVEAARGLLRRQGRLAGATDPVAAGDGNVFVVVRLRPTAVSRQPASSGGWTPRRFAVVAGFTVAMLVLLAVAAWLVLSWLAAHWLPLVAVAGVVVLAGTLLTPRAVRVIVSVTVR